MLYLVLFSTRFVENPNQISLIRNPTEPFKQNSLHDYVLSSQLIYPNLHHYTYID